MATLMKPNGAMKVVKPKANRDKFDLADLYELVGCQQVEMITLASGHVMWVDEEAKLERDVMKRKEVNWTASRMLRQAGGMPGDQVLGDVLVMELEEVD